MPGTQTFGEVYPLMNVVGWNSGSGSLELDFLLVSDSSWRIDELIASNSDGVDHTISVAFFNVTPVPSIGSVLVPAGAGYGAVPAVNLIAGLVLALQGGWAMPIGQRVLGFIDSLPSGSTVVTVTALGGTL